MITEFGSRAYLICGDARTGSSLLSGTLRLTEVAGKPYEYFGMAEIDKPWLRYELRVPEAEPFVDFRTWRDYIVNAGSEPNGVFGASVHWFQFGHVLAAFRDPETPTDLRPIDELRRFFPELRLIRLRRKNVVAQAISHYVAMKTGLWNHSAYRAAREGGPPVITDSRAPYDFAAIDWQVKSANVAVDGWRETLAPARDITLELSYEELNSDLPGAVRKVLDHIGQSLKGPLPPPILLKQAGPWSQELERLYRAERAARGLGPVGDEADI